MNQQSEPGPSPEQSHEMQILQLRTMLEVNRKLNSTLDLDALLNVIIQVATELTATEAASILLLDEKTGELHFEAVTGAKKAEVKPLVVPLEGSIAGWIVTRNQPLVVNDTQDDPRHYTQADRKTQFDTRSILGVPLHVKDRTIGVLEVLNKRDNSPFTGQDQEMLETLAAQAAVAIENARLHAETEQRAQQLAVLHELDRAMTASLRITDVYYALAGHAARLLSYDRMAITLLEGEELRTAYAVNGDGPASPTFSTLPVKGSAAGWVAARGQPQLRHNIAADPRFVEDEHLLELGIRSTMLLPLRVKGQIIGTWNIGSQQIGAYGPDDLTIAQSMADQLAIAIENARLYQDLQDQMQAREEAQARLLQSEKLAAIGELVAGVAHELNNPLTTIIGFGHMLQRNHLEDQIKADLNKIVTQAQRAADIVRGLLDFARQRPPEQKPVQINDVLNSTLDLLAYELRTHNIETQTALASGLPLTMADPYQLQQVFVNLINNARQAMSAARGGGRLTLTTELAPSTFLQRRPGTAPVIRVIVQDDGPGIAPELLPRIFDPFFTTKPVGEGTGLGMAVCHGIINEHGGNIWVESVPGQGATFFVELPVVRPQILGPAVRPEGPEAPASQRANGRSGRRARILLIDDEVDLLDVLIRALQIEGYQVDAVSNGEAALDRLNQNGYDLILCDVRMPGLSGLEIYEQMQGRFPELARRLVFITGDTVSPHTRRFLDETGAPYLDKPFELEDLIARVPVMLDSN